MGRYTKDGSRRMGRYNIALKWVSYRKQTRLAAAPASSMTTLFPFVQTTWQPASNEVEDDCSSPPFPSLGCLVLSIQTEAELSIEIGEKGERGALFAGGELGMPSGFR